MGKHLKWTAVLFIFCELYCARCQDICGIQPINATEGNSGSEIRRAMEVLQPNSVFKYIFTDYSKYNNISHIIFQVHSYEYDIVLSDNQKFWYNSSISGTNVGLYHPVESEKKRFYLQNNNNYEVTVLISVVGYAYQDPIPGGCNMEFPVPTSPFLTLDINADYITVQGSPASDEEDDPVCTISSQEIFEYHFYELKLPQRDFSMCTYFDGIIKMMTVENIIKNGTYVPLIDETHPLQRKFSLQPGVGSIYVMVVTHSSSAAYVPIHSYGCKPSLGQNCYLFEDAMSQTSCILMIGVGAFLCYFGHRFFKSEMFLMGFMSGGMVSYIVLFLTSEMNRPALIGASILSGLCFGWIWLLFWWYYGYPALSVKLATLNVGFLFASLLYTIAPGTYSIYYESTVNFWTLFIVIMFSLSMVLITMTYTANILCCVILGSYAIIYPMDLYLGSNLKYIVINIIRRTVVPKYGTVNLSTIFQWRDGLLLLFWVFLCISGFLVQYYHNRGKPPFPPPPRSVGPRVPMNDIASRTYGSMTGRTRFANGNVNHEKEPLLA